MITKAKFRALVEQGLIASVRVVPVPMEMCWCVDAIIRMPMEAGSTTDTLATPTDNNASSSTDNLRRFTSIDEAAEFLKSVDIRTFTVDTSDSISFVGDQTEEVRYVERSVRLWDMDDEQEEVKAVS